MESTPEPAAYVFDFNNFPSADANGLKFNDVASSDNDLIIPTFVDTLKPVLSGN